MQHATLSSFFLFNYFFLTNRGWTDVITVQQDEFAAKLEPEGILVETIKSL